MGSYCFCWVSKIGTVSWLREKSAVRSNSLGVKFWLYGLSTITQNDSWDLFRLQKPSSVHCSLSLPQNTVCLGWQGWVKSSLVPAGFSQGRQTGSEKVKLSQTSSKWKQMERWPFPAFWHTAAMHHLKPLRSPASSCWSITPAGASEWVQGKAGSACVQRETDRERFRHVSWRGFYATVLALRLLQCYVLPACIQSCLTVLTVERTILTAQLYPAVVWLLIKAVAVPQGWYLLLRRL